jgi:endoglucanase
MGTRPWIATALATTCAVAVAVVAAGPSGAAAGAAQVRVDQAGYLPNEAKHAYVLAPKTLKSATFTVADQSGHTALSGKVSTTNRGKWNTAYPGVYDITFSSLTTPGRYRITVGGDVTATSPWFDVASANALYGKLFGDGVTFDQVQRDGSDVIAGALHRKASHLNDVKATVYATPHFQSDSDVITDSDLKKIGGPVDVSGGWFDAGDYLKFTHTTAYNDVLLYASARAVGNSAALAEARFGSDWLTKMWDAKSKTLYLQVGIGSGNAAGSFTGDHDLWRRPQADDGDKDAADRYAATHRPVFEAAAPGKPISPNLVGRVAAAFALAAQADSDPAQGRADLAKATSLYALAATSSAPNPLVTALPNAFYPEDTWHDDMELGAAEIALASQQLGQNAAPYLANASTWAKAYIADDTGDTFNLYDTSALAHTDLVRALDAAHDTSGLRTTLINDLKRQLNGAAQRAASDPFNAGVDYADFDVDSHTFGLIATAGWYHALSGSSQFDEFAAEQRGWVLGANAWGVSFMVGEGSTFPHCIQHQVANLDGTTNGQPPLAVGAVVNGPNGSDQFDGGLGDFQDGMIHCGVSYSAFDGHSSRFVDDVRSWQTDEPALDMTGAAIIAASSQMALLTPQETEWSTCVHGGSQPG